MSRSIARLGLALLLAGAMATSFAKPGSTRSATAPPHWATSWFAPAQPAWQGDFVLPLGMPQQLQDVTLRQHLRVSLGGERIRLMLSNEYGRAPLRVARTHVGLEGAAGGGTYATFQGAPEVVVAAGAKALSDPLALPVAPGTRLTVDLYLRERAHLSGFHWEARDQSLLLPGNAAGRSTPGSSDDNKLATRAFLSAVLVETSSEPVAVVALGDSITDGNGATPGADQRWPDHLARQLAPYGVAVLNAGISGNRLLRDGMGESALARFERDVLQHRGVRTVIVMLGTNDIGWPGAAFAPHEKLPDATAITDGLRQLVAQAHVRGVRVVGATITPFEGALKGTPLEGHYSPRKESLRQAVNDWIRHAGVFDAVVDFDRLLRDTSHPTRLRPQFDSGDHLHPNDAGYQAMADRIDLRALLLPGRSQ